MKTCHLPCDPSNCPGCPMLSPSLMGGLSSDPLQHMKNIRRGYQFERGEQLPTEIEGSAGFHIVRQGKIKISFGEPKARVVRIDGPGSLTGLTEANFGGSQMHAIESTHTCFFPMDEVSKVALRSTRLFKNITDCLSKSLQSSNGQIYSLSKTSAKARIADLLCRLQKDFGVESPFGSKIDVHVDRRTLADMAGTAVESLSRTITEFENDGILRREGWTLHIVDSTALNRWANS